MRRLGPLLAGALVLVTNIVALVGVASNRRGDPDSSVTLTERELRIESGEKENSGMSLRLDWSATGAEWDLEPVWFDRAKLEEVGFDCRLPLTDASAELRYGKALPVQGYVVLEFDGEAWTRWLARQEEAIRKLEGQVARGDQAPTSVTERRKQLAADRIGRSRLFAIDVGRDGAALRRRYPDRSRYIVTSAVLRLEYRKRWDETTREYGEPLLAGSISELLVGRMHVALDQRPVLDAVVREESVRDGQSGGWERYLYGYASSLPVPPRYEVSLDYGRRYEPWVAGVRRLEATHPETRTGS